MLKIFILPFDYVYVYIYIYTHWGLEVSKRGIFAGGKDTLLNNVSNVRKDRNVTRRATLQTNEVKLQTAEH